ncbi:hypothetical protein U3A55_08685 [Salarchaeum sp. III]|uniref:hypothetical protein n=1 Tax=Salarchaeum sp. III TaxID=3107927 RepID=UPI002ED8506F
MVDFTSINRREAVKGVLAASFPATERILGNATDQESNKRYVGYSYCPMTEQGQTTATAILDLNQDGLKGVLNVAGFRIPIGQRSRIDDSADSDNISKYHFSSNKEAHQEVVRDSTVGLKGYIQMTDSQATGVVSRPSGAFGDIAFTLGESSKGFTSELVKRSLNTAKRKVSIQSFDRMDIPTTGIPRENSFESLDVLDETSLDSGTARRTAARSEKVDSRDGVSTESTSGHDVGIFDQSNAGPNSLTHVFDDNCSASSATMTWEYEFATSSIIRYNQGSPAYGIDTDYDEIEAQGGEKPFHLQAYFSDPPDPLVLPCDERPGYPYASKVEFWAQHDEENSYNKANLEDAVPNSTDSQDPSLILDTVLNIISGVGGPWVAGVASIIDYALTLSDVNNGTIRRTTNDGGIRQWYWDLPLSYGGSNNPGNNFFPDAKNDTAGVKVFVENTAAEGIDVSIDTKSKMTWGYYDYTDGRCPCGNTNFTTILKTQQTIPHTNTCTYKSVLSD